MGVLLRDMSTQSIEFYNLFHRFSVRAVVHLLNRLL